MTRTTKILLATGAIALGAMTFAGTSLAGGGWDRHHGRGPGGPGPILFETFDTDQDGQLTQAEIDQERTSRFDRFDQDQSDGGLTLEEYEALWSDAMRARMVDRFQAHDDDGDGVVTKEEFLASHGNLIDRLDRDGDGVISRDDMRQRMARRGDRGRRGWNDDQDDD